MVAKITPWGHFGWDRIFWRMELMIDLETAQVDTWLALRCAHWLKYNAQSWDFKAHHRNHMELWDRNLFMPNHGPYLQRCRWGTHALIHKHIVKNTTHLCVHVCLCLCMFETNTHRVTERVKETEGHREWEDATKGYLVVPSQRRAKWAAVSPRHCIWTLKGVTRSL